MPPVACANCGADLSGEYCSACGQRRPDPRDLQVGHFVRTAADEALHLESRILRSLVAVFRPGHLTAEYLAGRRQRYTAPLKLYFACAAIFFLLAPVSGFTLDRLLQADRGGTLTTLVERTQTAKGLTPERFEDRFDLRFQTVYTVSLFVSVVGGALMLALLFRRQRRPFGAHVVFELHYVSFLYLATIILGFVLRFAPPNPALNLTLTMAALAPFLAFALKRVYAEPWRATLLKTAAMLLFGFVLDNIVNLGALLVTLALV